ncbi:MAG: 50S ribosomal protein L4 [Bdellovibrionales bacterium]|nr:50S ribosomal protein L4 [Bdellovibrionales bacterium]
MPTLDVMSLENKKVGSVNLSDAVFGAEVNVPLVHQVVKAQLATRRQGTAKTKTKAEVRGGGKKPFKQKGTGNARQGSSRSPLQPGGGRIFGPRPRDYTQRTNRKMVNGALRSILSDRVKAGRLMVIDSFDLKEIKTKVLADIFGKKLNLTKALVIDEANKNLELSGRNLKGVRVMQTGGLNVYDVIRHDWVVFSKRAVESVDKRLAVGAKAK